MENPLEIVRFVGSCGSFAPKHEIKTASVAFLFNEWFDMEHSTWTKKGIKKEFLKKEVIFG